VKKQVAERWKRGAKAPWRTPKAWESRRRRCRRRRRRRGEGNGEGVSPPNRLGGLGERRELPERGPGGAQAENEFDVFCGW